MHILTINSCSLFTGGFSSPFSFLAFPNFSITITPFPGDFMTNVKQINSQLDSSFSWPFLSYSQILLLHHFNLRSLHFQSLQSLPNWIQLPTLEISPVCTSFQTTNETNVICDKIIVLCDLNCVIHFRKGIAGKFQRCFTSPGS